MVERRVEAETPPPFNMRVSANAPREFEMWHWAASPMFDIQAPNREQQRSFTLRTTGYHFAGMAISRTESTATEFDRSRAVIGKSGIDSFLFQVYLSGGYRLDAESTASEVHPGDIAVFDLTRESRIRADNYTNVSVVMQRSLLAPVIADLDRLHGLILRSGTPLNELLKSHLLMLHAQAPRIVLAEQASSAQGTAALFAACFGPSADARDIAAKSVAVSLLQAIRQSIDVNLANPDLNPDFLVAQFGLSRASLYRLFEPFGGVRTYIHQRRLMRTYQSVSDPHRFEERIGAIAQRWGFSNDSVFSRAFRDLYGMTPSEVRSAAKVGYLEATQHTKPGETSFWALNRWLLGLETNGQGK